jgi:hypothetical protein
MNVDEEGGGFCSFISGAEQTRMYKRTQHASLLSSGWMNRDEDKLLFVGFGCSTDLDAQEKNNMQAF